MIKRRTLALALAAVMLSLGVAAEAEAYGPRGGYHRGGGYYHGGHGGRGYWGPGLVLGGIGLGIGLSGYYNGYYGSPWYPGYVVSEPPVVVYDNPVPTAPRAVPAAPAPDPIIYPRSGQSPAQTEADTQACNRWATSQPNAMADASVFHRATLACMEGRGYTVR